MDLAEETPLTVDELAKLLKCSRGWVQLSIDAGCPRNDFGQISIRDFMMFQLANIHHIRSLAGLPTIESQATESNLRPNVKLILTTQLEWLQTRTTQENVKKAAKLVYDKMQAMDDL